MCVEEGDERVDEPNKDGGEMTCQQGWMRPFNIKRNT